ncbi:MAG: sugar ABC transporter permease [Trueperaceae bacterium]|nr:sugar ABC transporter permease [Trueperaceae bacterium]
MSRPAPGPGSPTVARRSRLGTWVADLAPYFRKPNSRQEMLMALSFLAPSLLVLVAFVYFPIVWAFGISFTNWQAGAGTTSFVGVKNYVDSLTSGDFQNALKNSLYFLVLKLPIDMALSLLVALLLNQKLRGMSVFRVALFMPVVTSMVAAAAIWRVLYNPSSGFFNTVLNSLGFLSLRWLRDPNLAMPSVVLVALWKGLGYNIVIFLAGLQSISRVYYEAAEIDGATTWQRFRYITLPLLSPVTYFVLLIGVINSFKVFSLVHVLAPDGGPLNSVEVLVFYLYRLTFQRFKFGQGAAVSFILFAIVLGLTFIQQRVAEKRVHYE